jgi:hypothetical protein
MHVPNTFTPHEARRHRQFEPQPTSNRDVTALALALALAFALALVPPSSRAQLAKARPPPSRQQCACQPEPGQCLPASSPPSAATGGRPLSVAAVFSVGSEPTTSWLGFLLNKFVSFV